MTNKTRKDPKKESLDKSRLGGGRGSLVEKRRGNGDKQNQDPKNGESLDKSRFGEGGSLVEKSGGEQNQDPLKKQVRERG